LLQRVSVYINHHQGALGLCFAKVTILTSVTYIVIWIYRYCDCICSDLCNRSQHCDFGEVQVESSLMMVYVNRNMLEQLL